MSGTGGQSGGNLPPPLFPPGSHITRMPIPSEKSAPKWDGKEKNVAEFLRNFEVVADQANLSELQKRIQLGRYCRKAEDQNLLEQLPGFKTSWDDYKLDIIRFFPKADPDRLYTRSSLNKFVRKWSKKKSFKDASKYALYNQKFLKIVGGLEKRKLLAADEKARLYSEGFPPKTKKAIIKRLEIQLTNHDPDVEYTFDELWEAVRYLIKKDLNDSDDSEEEVKVKKDADDTDSDSDSDDSDDEKPTKDKKTMKQEEVAKLPAKRDTQVRIKEEPDLRDMLLRMNTQVHTLSQTIQNMRQNPNPSQSRYVGRPSQPTLFNPGNSHNRRTDNTRPQQFDGCLFCGRGDHYMKSCLLMQSYLEKGIIKRDEQTRRLVLRTGEPIPSDPPNSTLQVRVDTHIKKVAAMYQEMVVDSAFTRSEPQASTLFFEKVPTLQAEAREPMRLTTENTFSSMELRELVQAIERPPKKVITRHEMTTRSMESTKPKEAPKQILKPPRAPINNKSLKEEPTKVIEAPNDSPPKVMDMQGAPIRHVIKSPAENPKLIEEVIQFLKQGKLSEVTPAHIYAASPEVRAKIINYLRGQKVEVHHLLDRTSVMYAENKIVGAKSLPLRELEVTFPNGFIERSILDDGSSIVVMREDLWKEIGTFPLLRQEALVMECADASQNATLGMVEDLPIKIGKITFYVQSQVVRSAPYRFLLGRPFNALAAMNKHDFVNGDQLVSLTDPNNPNYTETFPTFARVPPGDEEEIHLFLQDSGRRFTNEALPKILLMGEESVAKYLPIEIGRAEAFSYKKKYKPADKKVKPVPSTLPEEFRVVRRIPRDPLITLPTVPTKISGTFISGSRLTTERWLLLESQIRKDGFLWEEEISILREV